MRGRTQNARTAFRQLQLHIRLRLPDDVADVLPAIDHTGIFAAADVAAASSGDAAGVVADVRVADDGGVRAILDDARGIARDAARLPRALHRAGDGAVPDAVACGVRPGNAAGIEPPGNRPGERAILDKAFIHSRDAADRLAVAAGLDIAGDVQVIDLTGLADFKEQSGGRALSADSKPADGISVAAERAAEAGDGEKLVPSSEMSASSSTVLSTDHVSSVQFLQRRTVTPRSTQLRSE